MIRRSVRARFHTVHWIPPTEVPPAPVIFVANHHGWHDGYLMFHLVQAMQRPALDWIQEFDAFPLFDRVGGMPFPLNDPGRRATTIRKTVRAMNDEGRSLMLFAESHLHYPPELLEFGKALELVARQVPTATVLPVAIRYEMAMHERPEAFMAVGNPVEKGPNLSARTRLAVHHLLDEVTVATRHHPERYQVLVQGTKDVNERMDMRSAPWSKKRR